MTALLNVLILTLLLAEYSQQRDRKILDDKIDKLRKLVQDHKKIDIHPEPGVDVTFDLPQPSEKKVDVSMNFTKHVSPTEDRKNVDINVVIGRTGEEETEMPN